MPIRSLPIFVVQGQANAVRPPQSSMAAAAGAPIRGTPVVVGTGSNTKVLAGSSQPMTTKSGNAIGIDLSTYEGVFNPRAASTPLDFAVIKASEGQLGAGSSYGTNYQQNYAAASGVVPIIGAYHYLRTDYPIGSQVNAFLGSIQNTNPAFLAVDVEQQQGKMFLKSPAQLKVYSQQALDFIGQLQQRTNKPVFLYTNAGIYNQNFHGSNIPLWLSYPTSSPNPLAVGSQMIGKAQPIAIQQTSFGAPAQQFGVKPPSQGGALGVDFDVFNGSAAQMQTYINSITR